MTLADIFLQYVLESVAPVIIIDSLVTANCWATGLCEEMNVISFDFQHLSHARKSKRSPCRLSYEGYQKQHPCDPTVVI